MLLFGGTLPQSLKQIETAILVHVDLPELDSREYLQEFKELTKAAGAKIVDVFIISREAPDPKYFVGSGKIEEIATAVQSLQPDLVIFNQHLSPSQERNIEKSINCRVLDRIGLILDIFAQRARTFEGKLQVELAQLTHLSTRLIRGWTHLERQKGGIGLRGPGESQLESDRRLIRERIKSIEKRLNKVRKQRAQSRHARKKSAFPTVSLVGYTNSGKTTLFKQLTGEAVEGENKLFATLDPTIRKLELSGTSPALLVDTVGFIRHLPHNLIAAFQATLEETQDADLLLHVIDISNPVWQDQVDQVNKVLTEISASSVPQMLVYNKIDLCENLPVHLNRDLEGKPNEIWLSAYTGQGLKLLSKAISEFLFGDPIYRTIILTPDQGKLRDELYRLDTVINERIDEQGNCTLAIKIAKYDYQRLFDE